MEKLKRILLTLLIAIGALFIINAPVNAVEKSQLQLEVEETINTAVDSYLRSVNINDSVNQIIDETLETYINELNQLELKNQKAEEEAEQKDEESEVTSLKTQIIQEASSAFMRYISDFDDSSFSIPETGEILEESNNQNVVNMKYKGLQSTLEDALISTTYNLNETIKNYIKNFIITTLRSRLNQYNTNMTKLHATGEDGEEYRYVNGKKVYYYEQYIISDREIENILAFVSNRLDTELNLGENISSKVLENVTAVSFNACAKNYIEAKLKEYKNSQELLDKVKIGVKNTISDNLKGKITEAVTAYVNSGSGDAIFKGIKNAIYEYINGKTTEDKSGLDILKEEGFDSKAANKISEEIGNIVKDGIKYALTPYINDLVNEKIAEVINNITTEYVNNGAFQIIKDAVKENLDEILESDTNPDWDLGGDEIRNNLVKAIQSYLNNSKIVNIIDDALQSAGISKSAISYIHSYETNRGNTRYETVSLGENKTEISGDSGIISTSDISKITLGELILKQTVVEAKNYMHSTVFKQVIAGGKTAITNYMNGQDGEKIRKTFIENLNNLFKENVTEPVLSEINDSVAAWISNGIGTDVTDKIRNTVVEYLQYITDPVKFEQETGIRLGIILKEVRNPNPGAHGRIALEDLVKSKYLIGAERGRIVVPKENGANALDDATLELGTMLTYKVKAYTNSFKVVVNPYWFPLSAMFRFFPNPYKAAGSAATGKLSSLTNKYVGVSIGVADLSRTLANYKIRSMEIDANTHETSVNGIKNLNTAEAYVLAHEKHIGFYPDRTQEAYYAVLKELRGIEGENDEGMISEDTYNKIRMALGIVDVVASINFKQVWSELSNAKNIGEFIKNIPIGTIISLLQTAGVINIYKLFSFINPNILSILDFCGIGPSKLIGMVASLGQNTIGDILDFKFDFSNLSATASAAWNNIKQLPTKIVNDVIDATWGRAKTFIKEVYDIGKKVGEIIAPIKTEALDTRVQLWQETSKIETMQKEYDNLNEQITAKQIEAQSKTGSDLVNAQNEITVLEGQRDAKETEINGQYTKIDNLTTKAEILSGELNDACSPEVNYQLLQKLSPSEAAKVSRLFAQVPGLGEAIVESGNWTSLYQYYDKISTLPDYEDNLWGVSALTEGESTQIQSTKDKILAELQNDTRVQLIKKGINALTSLNKAIESADNTEQNFSNYSLISDLNLDPALIGQQTNSEDALIDRQSQQFIEAVNTVDNNNPNAPISKRLELIYEEWLKNPGANIDVVTSTMEKLAKECGGVMTGPTANEMAKKLGLTVDEFWEKVKQAGGNTGTTVVNMLGSMVNSSLISQNAFSNLLQMALPMKNEITADYEFEDPTAGAELAAEALALDKALKQWDEFEQNHEGNNLVDLTDYTQVKVSYKKDTDEILVGPFKIDYVRTTYLPTVPEESEMVYEDIKVDGLDDEVISFTGIVDAELYADDNKEVKVSDWEFVYPDEYRDIRQEGDTEYPYPYPNEIFYLKFPSQDGNYSINTLSRMTFELAKMDADGQTHTLKGEYEQLMWMTTGIGIRCLNGTACIHGIVGGHALPTVPPTWCPIGFCPIHTASGSGLVGTINNFMSEVVGSTLTLGGLLSQEYAVSVLDKIGILTDHMAAGTHYAGWYYFCYPITIGSGLHAQNLEEIIYSKIYTEYQTVELNFGAAYQKDVVYQTYHSTDVNTTNGMDPSVHQGNISIEQDSVPGENGVSGVPFLDNYDSYPAWPGNYKTDNAEYKTVYKDNPNYPDSPYYPDNEVYKDYPSYPYYNGEAKYPYPIPNPQSKEDLVNPVIPLTFHIEGNVWLDNPSGVEADADGYMADNERGIPNVEVLLYRVDDPDNPQITDIDDPDYYIAKTLTDENGHYEFEYVRVGFYYYVKFLYDGMTYRTTKYLDTDLEEYNGENIGGEVQDYKENPEAFLDNSHALEDAEERDEFNKKFYYISENLATSEDGYDEIDMEYQTWYTANGAASTVITTDKRGITLDEYKMPARTLMIDGTGVTYALDDMYQVDSNDLDLFYSTTEYYTRTYPGLEHVNLGLIQREQGDMAVRTDLYQIITKFKNNKGEDNLRTYLYDERLNADDMEEGLRQKFEHVFDIIERNNGYYNEINDRDIINPADYSWRYDSEAIYGNSLDQVAEVYSEASELDVFLEYKIYIKNNATLHSGSVIVLESTFTNDLLYAEDGQKYDCIEPSASWLEIRQDGSETVDKEQIEWYYRPGSENGYFTIYTEDLQDIKIAPGEIIELHLILEVDKNSDRGLILDDDEQGATGSGASSTGGQGTGQGAGTENGTTGRATGGDGNPGPGVSGDSNNGTDNGRDVKVCITEIHTYAYDEGVICKAANPGSMKPGYSRTYSDSVDAAPLTRLLLDRNYVDGNEIRGYVWEDLINTMRNNNNKFEGDGLRDTNEPKINNVKVELIEVGKDDETGKEREFIRDEIHLTGNSYQKEDIINPGRMKNINVEKGEYRFTDLEAGTYKVKFTYGDYEQLSKDLTYNAQDYKSLSLDTTYQQYDNPQLELFVLLDTSNSMTINNKGSKMREAIQTMISKLYENVQKAKVGVISFAEPKGSEQIHIGLTQKPDSTDVLAKFVGNNNEFINKGDSLASAIRQALNEFSVNESNNTDGGKSRAIIILTDGHMAGVNARKVGASRAIDNEDKRALIEAERAGVQVITICASTDEWNDVVFGKDEEPTAGKLYCIEDALIPKYITKIALEDVLLKFEELLHNLTDAKDVEISYSVPEGSNVGDIYSRKRNIDYSSVMVNENSEVLHIENIKDLQKELNNTKDDNKAEELRAEIDRRIRELANATKVTAITPARNVLFSHDANRTIEVNLGLVERPQVDVEIVEEVSRIVVTLANGEVIVDTAKDITQNVQIINKANRDGLYSIYMDKEIMQGAKIDIQYKITITNNGQIDTLGDYFTYDMFNEPQTNYALRTVPIKIGTLNNYYTNLVFRAEDNTNLEIDRNDVQFGNIRVNGNTIDDYRSTLVHRGILDDKGKTSTPDFSKPTTTLLQDGRALALLPTPYYASPIEALSADGRAIGLTTAKITWEEKRTIALNEMADKAIEKSKAKVVQTTSLRTTELFPNMSKEVLNNNAESTISVYVNYTKNISANDSSDMLTYDNSSEIVERLSDVGRRDYSTKTGNYEPHDKEYTELDGALAERVMILPPFGENYSNYFVIAIVSVIVLGAGIVFIRKKVI